MEAALAPLDVLLSGTEVPVRRRRVLKDAPPGARWVNKRPSGRPPAELGLESLTNDDNARRSRICSRQRWRIPPPPPVDRI